jgi:hypothetical protein
MSLPMSRVADGLGFVIVCCLLVQACDAGVQPLEPGLGPLGRPGPAVEAATRDPARCRSTDADGWYHSGPFAWPGLGTDLEDGYAELGVRSRWAVESWSELSCKRDGDCAINVVSRCPAECTCDSLWGAVNRASIPAIAARQSTELYCTACGYAEPICLDLAKWSARCIEGVCMMCAR